MKQMDLNGIIPAIVMPMTEDYRVDEGALREYVRWIVPQGIKAIAVNTDAGEGPHLSGAEKRRILEIVAREVGGRVPVVAGVGAPYTDAAVQAAREARESGADAFLCFPINAFRGAAGKDPVILGYHEALASVGVPMILFQLQDALGGVEYPLETIAELVQLDPVVAIKEATFDALKYANTVAMLRSLPKRIAILTGNDNFILESFILGGDGALIGFGAIATRIQCDMAEAVRRRDYKEAERLYALITPLFKACFAHPVRDYRARIKAALVMLGVLPQATMRPPLLATSAAEEQAIRATLRHAGLLAG